MIKLRIYLLWLIGLIISQSAKASHIVGGEFELVYLEEDQYRLNLNLYYDLLNGVPDIKDSEVLAAVYSKRDNSLAGTFKLPFISSDLVDYFQPHCSNEEVVTEKFIYSSVINLAPDKFDDPEGYYIAWEHCCRNYGITNIFSEDPFSNTRDYAGQTFYLEFPAVVRNEEAFLNSSPILFPPLSDYACPFRTYWVNFQGIDPDGDSLVYTLVTPLSTHDFGTASLFGANPAPYPVVKWRPGFGLDNIMYGAPDLKISDDGFLTVTPTVQGLFVFAVKVEEYRDDIKIGEVRRDFQLLVVDKCPEAEAPVIKGKKLSESSFTYKEYMTVSFPANTPDAERCIEVQVTDPDALKASDNFEEAVYIQAIPLGFKEDVGAVLPDNITATLVNGSDATFQICFEECPYLKSGSFQIDIIAFDDACTFPLSDTLRIEIFVEPPPNNKVFFVDGDEYTVNVQESADGFYSRSFLARDLDNDSLTLNIKPVGFNPADYGITLNPGTNTPGEVEALLEWNFDCQKFSFDERTSFPFVLTVDDKDYCQFADEDILDLTLNIELPPNTEPEVDISVNIDGDKYHYIEQEINSDLVFTVSAKDDDNDNITLNGAGINFNFSDYKITFDPKEGAGVPGITSNFTWETSCDYNLAQQDSFRIHFYAEDFDKCQITNLDTIIVDVKLLPPTSEKPVLNVFSLNNIELVDNQVEIIIGETIELKFVGADQDLDDLILLLEDGSKLAQAEFSTVTGKGQISSNFTWQPDCSYLNGRDSTVITGHFLLIEDNCFDKSDTVSIDFIIHDTDNFEERFRAPNVITPNNDETNDYFVLEDILNNNGTERSMPEDNCSGQFEKIEVYNRWGRKVYESAQRDFKWLPDNEPAGVYYFYLIYTDKTYKGFVNVIF